MSGPERWVTKAFIHWFSTSIAAPVVQDKSADTTGFCFARLPLCDQNNHYRAVRVL